MSLTRKLIKQVILKKFFEIDLSGQERQTAEDSVETKYIPTIRYSFFVGLLILPPFCF